MVMSPGLLDPSTGSSAAGSLISNIIRVVSELQTSSPHSEGNPSQVSQENRLAGLFSCSEQRKFTLRVIKAAERALRDGGNVRIDCSQCQCLQ